MQVVYLRPAPGAVHRNWDSRLRFCGEICGRSASTAGAKAADEPVPMCVDAGDLEYITGV